MKHLYNSLVRSDLEYNNVIWSPSPQNHITQLEDIQRQATKLST